MWPSSSRGIESRELYFIRKPPARNGSGAGTAGETLSTTLKEVWSRILTAIQRLELCRFGFPLCPVPPPAKLRDFFWWRLFDSPAMSPLAHHARPHRFATRYHALRRL